MGPDLSELHAVLVRALPDGRRGEADTHAVAKQLSKVLEQARGAHPGVRVKQSAFVEHLARALAVDEPIATSLSAVQAADLYLAFACSTGDADALRRFENELFPELDKILAASDAPLPRTDVLQLIRERVFVRRRERPARIAEYRGQSELRNWFRLVALRLLANLTRGPHSDSEAEVEFSEQLLSMATPDSELQYLKAKYRAEFSAAIPEAFAALSPRERNLLRLSLLEGLSIDQLGAVHGVHRATVARWIVSTKASLAKALHRALKSRLQVDQAELESILRLIESQVHITLERVFGTDDGAADG